MIEPVSNDNNFSNKKVLIRMLNSSFVQMGLFSTIWWLKKIMEFERGSQICPLDALKMWGPWNDRSFCTQVNTAL